MEKIKQIFAFGTNDLNSNYEILVYNSESFYNKNIINILNLSENDLKLLRSSINPNNVNQIYFRLSNFNELFTPIKADGNKYIFKNNKLNCLSGQGFNIIIFLNNNLVVGYIELLKAVGYNYSTISENYSLKKNYLVNTIEIEINCNNILDNPEVNINIVNNIIESDRELPYLKKKDLSNLQLNLYKNYNKNIFDLVNGSRAVDILTSSNYIKFKNKNSKIYKLNIIKNVKIPEICEELPHAQIGYFKGDISLYLWDDLGKYSIISLTKQNTIGISKVQLIYTHPRLNISNNDIYQLPKLNGESLKIEYFSGKYIICRGNNNSRYIFDIDLQTGTNSNDGWVHIKRPTGNYTMYQKKGNSWVANTERILSTTEKTYKSIDLIPENIETAVVENNLSVYIRYFLLDSLDINNRLNISDREWQTYKDLIKDYPSLSNLYLDTEKLFNLGSYPTKKIGSWVIFNTLDGLFKIYTTDTKTIKLSINEPDPIVVNDQILITRDGNKFVMYDTNGYFITKSAMDLSNWNNIPLCSEEIFKNTYQLLDESDKACEISSTSSPDILQKSFFKYFRRNALPETLSDLEIIGGFEGIIFYRQNNNIINYI